MRNTRLTKPDLSVLGNALTFDPFTTTAVHSFYLRTNPLFFKGSFSFPPFTCHIRSPVVLFSGLPASAVSSSTNVFSAADSCGHILHSQQVRFLFSFHEFAFFIQYSQCPCSDLTPFTSTVTYLQLQEPGCSLDVSTTNTLSADLV